jgi:DNA-binding transcriptional MerR regulator
MHDGFCDYLSMEEESMNEQEAGRKITVEAAAERLGVSTKSIHRYVARGLLTKVKQGGRTFLFISEVDELKKRIDLTAETGSRLQGSTATVDKSNDAVTMDLERYERLLVELGELRTENRLFRQFEGALRENAEALTLLRQEVADLDARLRAVESPQPDVINKTEKETPEKPSKISPKPWWQK